MGADAIHGKAGRGEPSLKRKTEDAALIKLWRAGVSYREIARRIGITLGQATSRVQRMVRAGVLTSRHCPDPKSFGQHLREQRLEAERIYALQWASRTTLIHNLASQAEREEQRKAA